MDRKGGFNLEGEGGEVRGSRFEVLSFAKRIARFFFNRNKGNAGDFVSNGDSEIVLSSWFMVREADSEIYISSVVVEWSRDGETTSCQKSLCIPKIHHAAGRSSAHPI